MNNHIFRNKNKRLLSSLSLIFAMASCLTVQADVYPATIENAQTNYLNQFNREAIKSSNSNLNFRFNKGPSDEELERDYDSLSEVIEEADDVFDDVFVEPLPRQEKTTKVVVNEKKVELKPVVKSEAKVTKKETEKPVIKEKKEQKAVKVEKQKNNNVTEKKVKEKTVLQNTDNVVSEETAENNNKTEKQSFKLRKNLLKQKEVAIEEKPISKETKLEDKVENEVATTSSIEQTEQENTEPVSIKEAVTDKISGALENIKAKAEKAQKEDRLNQIENKINKEEVFNHETVNNVYLDRFKPTVKQSENKFYENRNLEVDSDGVRMITEKDSGSIIDLIKRIEAIDPASPFTPTIALTLKDCVGIAIAKHPAIISAHLNTDIYKHRIVQAWASYFPDFSASTDYNYTYTHLPDYSYSMKSRYVPNISAGLLLFDFGKTKAMADIAKTDYAGSKYDLQDSINEIIYAVKSAYYNLVFAQQQIDIYRTTIEEFELQLKAAQKYFAIGKKPQIDVAIAEYNVGSAKLNLVKAINTYEVAKVNLANTIGLPEFANYHLSETLSKFTCEEDLELLLKDAFSIRPDLLSYEKMVESSLLNVRKAKRDFAPDIRANSTFYHGGYDPYKENNYNVSVNLAYTQMNLLQLKKELDIATKSYKKSVADYENKRQSVYLEVKQAYIDMKSSMETVKQAALNVEQAKAQHYHAAGRYNAGLGDAIELKDSENTYMNAQLEYFQALLDYNTNLANLEKVVGRPVQSTVTSL